MSRHVDVGSEIPEGASRKRRLVKRKRPRFSTRDRRPKILCVVGTRPESIKMAPVIGAIRTAPWADSRVVVTGQHQELVDTTLAFFGIAPDVSLHVMRHGQSLVDLTTRLLSAVSDTLALEAPDIVLAQGDTTTVMATALACFYQKVPFGHIEAGLRTGTLESPYPEEANRVIAGHLASLHFAPTTLARTNLLREGIDGATIEVTGNTVIDALLTTAKRDLPIGLNLDPKRKLILVTAHRRDSFGTPLQAICRALAELHDRHEDCEFLWPIHPNPSVRPVVEAFLSQRSRFHLREPMTYGTFVSVLKRSHLVLTDSGGIQEEAPALGKPVLVLRRECERPEAISAGVAQLVGTNSRAIIRAVDQLLDDPSAYRLMALGASPYGDGKSAPRIVACLARAFGVECGESVSPARSHPASA